MSHSSRRKARIYAFQVIYNRQRLGVESEGEVLHRITAGLSDDHLHFSDRLIKTTWQNLEPIDQLIQKNLISWKQSRISQSLNALLRVCCCELRFFPETDGKIVLNEAIEMCKSYVDDRATGLLNGVLHAVWQDRQDQKTEPTA